MTGNAARGRLRGLFMVEVVTVCAGLGNGIAVIVLPWLVLQRTNDAAMTGVVAACGAAPLIVGSIFAGTVVDRLGSRASSIWSDLLSGLAMVLVAVAARVDMLPVAAIGLLAAVGSAFDQAGVTARVTMLPEIADRSGTPLHRVNAIHESVAAVAGTAGPGLGGLLIGLAGTEGALWVSAALPLLAMLVMLARPRPAVPAPTRLPTTGTAADKPAMLWTSTGRSFVDAWRDPLQRMLLVMSFLFFMISVPVQGIVLPKYFLLSHQPERLGLVVFCLSAGGVIGAVAYGQWGTRLRARSVVLVAVIGTNVVFLLMSLLPPLPVLLLLALLNGIIGGPLTPMVYMALQRRTPPENLGRAVGTFGAVACAAAPLGLLIGGWLVQTLGLQPAFLILALGLIPLTVVAVASSALHELDGAAPAHDMDASTQTPVGTSPTPPRSSERNHHDDE